MNMAQTVSVAGHSAAQMARLRARSMTAVLMLGLCASLSMASVWADLDVNAVAGTANIDGSPAGAGTQIQVSDASTASSVTTVVDGPNIPPFLKGQGRFDTGDVPQFNTGDVVTVSILGSGVVGQATATLAAGTTTVNVNAQSARPPSVAAIPIQHGFEDVAWQLNLDPFLSDPDTPISSLEVHAYNSHVTVTGHVLTFLYPQGVLDDVMTIYVQDPTFTVTAQIQVLITPVNDPPSISKIPGIILSEGGTAAVDLSGYVQDPDNALGTLVMSVSGGAIVDKAIQGTTLTVSAQPGKYGKDSLTLAVSDPEGLSDTEVIDVEVSVNTTALIQFYESQIDALNAQISELSGQNENLSSQMDLLLEEISSLQGEQDDLEQQLKEARDLLQQLEAMRAQSRLYEQTIAGLESEKLNLSAQVDSLQRTLDATISSYRAAISQLNATKIASEAQIVLYEERVAEIEASLSELESNSSLQQRLIANLTNEKAWLETLIAAKAEEVSRLEELADGLKAQVSRLEQEKALAEASLAELNRSVDQLREKNSELLSQIDELTSKAPAQLVEGNGTQNLTTPKAGLAESLASQAARLAGGGFRLFSAGVKSKMGLLVVAMIVSVSAVSIAARSSWVRVGSGRKRQRPVQDVWENIEGKAMSARERPGQEPSITSGPAPQVILLRRKPSRVMAPKKVVVSARRISAGIVRKPPAPEEVARPAGERRVSAGHLLGIHPARPASRSGSPQAAPLIRPSWTASSIPQRPVHAQPTPSTILPGPGAARPAREAQAQDLAQVHQGMSRGTDEKEGSSAAVSKADMEYIENLMKLGFTKEAEEELRKLHKAR